MAKIKLKIQEAWENVKNRTNSDGETGLIGYTSEGIPLQFRIENHPPSVFANFKYLNASN